MKVTSHIPSFDRPKSPTDDPSFPSQRMNVLEAVGEPEISHKQTNALQQIGRSRHQNDGNSAIELFLDDSASTSTMGILSLKNDHPKSFMNRWFWGSRHPPVGAGVTSRPAIHCYYQHSDKAPLEMSALRKTRSFIDSPTITKSSHNGRVQGGNSILYPSTNPSSRSNVCIPHGILGNDDESIGTRSMEEIQNARKLMNQRLSKTPNSELGISREKVIQALFMEADALEDMDERNLMRQELEGILQTERQVEPPNPKKTRAVQIRSKYLRWSMNNQQNRKHRGRSTGLSPAKSTHIQTNNKANSNPFSSTRIVVRSANDEKMAVEKALDDLIWTEFVVNRRRKDESNHASPVLGPTGARRQDKRKKIVSGETVEVKQPLQTEPADASLHVANLCWGVAGLTTASACTNDEASSSSSSPSEGHAGDLDTESEEAYDDDGTTDSEPNLSYLPTRITITDSSSDENKPSSPLASSVPLVPSKTDFQNAMKPRNARNRVHFK